MTIKEILELPINTSVYGDFTVKKSKKNWETSPGDYLHQVLLADKTGEILADFHTITYNPLVNGQHLALVEAIIQTGEYTNKLYVETWRPTEDSISEPPTEYHGEAHIVRSKIKCLLTAAHIQHYGLDKGKVLEFLRSKECKEIIEDIMNGE